MVAGACPGPPRRSPWAQVPHRLTASPPQTLNSSAPWPASWLGSTSTDAGRAGHRDRFGPGGRLPSSTAPPRPSAGFGRRSPVRGGCWYRSGRSALLAERAGETGGPYALQGGEAGRTVLLTKRVGCQRSVPAQRAAAELDEACCHRGWSNRSSEHLVAGRGRRRSVVAPRSLLAGEAGEIVTDIVNNFRDD